jgi:predicted nucleotidyltransferase
MMTNKTSEYKDILLPIILQHLPDSKVILYGSRARGDFHVGSDIDIAIDNHKKIKGAIIGAIIYDIEESIIPITFDIVDFWSVSDEMSKNILKDAVIWKE